MESNMLIVREPEEVARWRLAFHLKRGLWLPWERLIPGRFTHVSAFTYLGGPKCWLLIEQSPRTNARVVVWPDASESYLMPPTLAQWTDDCSILTVDVRQRYGFSLKLGFWCVSAVKDLVGSKSWALSPEGLWRDMVRTGARVVYDNEREGAAAAAGPDADGRDEAGADRAAEGGPVVAQ
jgi:hypothetical protein